MFLDRLIKVFTSLKLTVVCLTLAMLLVFFGTLAQVDLGLYKAQNEFFRSFLIYWGPKGADWKIPVFPGGYLIGGLLLINLIAAHYSRFGFHKDKFGIIITHLGLILLLMGQLATDMLSTESSLHLRNGETKNYSESDRLTELAVIGKVDPRTDQVVAIPDSRLAGGSVIRTPELPFAVRVKHFYRNSLLVAQPADGFEKSGATQGAGPDIWIREEPRTTKMDERDTPSALVELEADGKSLGSWLVSTRLAAPQTVAFNGRAYDLILRLRRYYIPFNLQLLEFKHDIYAGTDIPKNFSSQVRVLNPATGEDREVKIKMNTPLRYGGLTFYQASFDQDDRGSILEVVRNPSWVTPYLACLLVGVGLGVQFLSHLVPFVKRRLTT
jgi:hypothetical protein